MEKNPYDEIPYVSQAYLETHPACMEGLGELFGIDPPESGKARVLELGCASGGNLLPIAQSLPNSRCLGVDLSKTQIDRANELKNEAGLNNVEFRRRSILDMDPGSIGEFDYIICHGVYSWVPHEVRERILEICGKCLSPGGMGYVSMNVYPGWMGKMWVRQALLLLSRSEANLIDGVKRGLGFLEYMTVAQPHASMPIMPMVKQELEFLKKRPVSYIVHEYLEVINQPFYFEEFAGRLAAHKLAFLCDARVNGINVSNHPVMQRFLEVTKSDRVMREQYIDFLTNRGFRRTLIVRSDRPMDWNGMQARIEKMHLYSASRSKDPIPANGPYPAEATFAHPSSGSILSREPGMIAMLNRAALAAPLTTPASELLEIVRKTRNLTPEQFAGEKQRVLRDLAQYVLSNLMLLYKTPPSFGTNPGLRPCVSPLARRCSVKERQVTNYRHEQVMLDPQSAAFIQMCDGTKTEQDLIAAMPTANIADVQRAITQLARQALLVPQPPQTGNE